MRSTRVLRRRRPRRRGRAHGARCPRAPSCSGRPRGLADVVAARLLGGVRRRVVGCSSAAATTAATRCTRAPQLPTAGRGVPTRSLLGAPRTRAALAALPSAGAGVSPRSTATAPGAGDAGREADVVLDGIAGIGGRPGCRAGGAGLLERLPDARWSSPSTCRAASTPTPARARRRDAVHADVTVTFGVAKPGHLLDPATEPRGGRADLVDIGLDRRPRAGRGRAARRATTSRALLAGPRPADDKYARGVLGIVAGGERATPARPCSCVTGARAAGAGMVRYVGAADRRPALVRAAVPGGRASATGRVQAWVVGPGLDAAATEHGARAARRAARAALASRPAGARGRRRPRPRSSGRGRRPTAAHPARRRAGPAARPARPAEVERADVAAAPSARPPRRRATGATVLLKGATTLVVAPGERRVPVRSQADAPPWLATAGAGDVLAGLAGTLLAAGLDPLDAGSVGRLVHGAGRPSRQPGRPGAARSAWPTPYPASWRALLRARGRADARETGRR